MNQNNKRVFFALDLQASWEDERPHAKKIIKDVNRHLTLVFLGQNSIDNIEKILPKLPNLPIKIGSVGNFDNCIFLPNKEPRVVAYRAKFLEKENVIFEYQKELVSYLLQNDF